MEPIASPAEGRAERAPESTAPHPTAIPTARDPRAPGSAASRPVTPEPTPVMLVCRYAYAFLVPVLTLVWSLLPTLGPERIVLVVTWLALSLPLSAGANGSLRSTRWTAWHLGMAIESVVLIVAMAWGTLSGDGLVIPFAMTLLMGAVLGFGAAQLWRSLQRRRG